MAAYERLAVDNSIQPPDERPAQGIGPNGPATLFQRLSFTWVDTLLRHGKSQPLALQDYPPLRESLKVQTSYGELDRAWRAEVARAAAGTPNLWVVLWRLYKKPFALMGVARLFQVLSTFAGAYFFQHFVANLEQEGSDPVVGALWVAALVVNRVVEVPASQQLTAIGDTAMTRARSALRMAVYRKLLTLPSGVSKGGVVTVMTKDVSRIIHLAWTMHTGWSAPLTIVLSIAMAASILGWAVVPAVIFAVLLAPLNWMATSQFDKISDGLMKWSSRRMKQVTEAVQGIAVIKFFAWESAFAVRVGQTRAMELKFVKKFSISIAGLMTVGWVSSSVLAVAAFLAYSLLGLPLTASVVFPVVYLFDSIVWPMLNLPEVLGSVSSARTSVRRMTDFLCRPEVSSVSSDTDAQGSVVWLSGCSLVHEPVKPIVEDSDSDEEEGKAASTSTESLPAPAPAGAGITAHDAPTDLLDSDYDSDDHVVGIQLLPTQRAEGDSPGDGEGRRTVATDVPVEAVHNVTLRFQPGTLAAVVGAVGAGKSTLLSGLLGEVKVASGSLGVVGSVAYVPQQAWIRSATVRDNILCGSPFDHERYSKVVSACALLPDFQQLPAADFTEIGERGITLSGGQKQRISLARAVYRDADVYLLDDPLSAVDAHVGHWLFERCIGPHGLLARKTRVLVSHQLQVLPDVDVVVVMDAGRVKHRGSYADLCADGVHFESLAPMESMDGGGAAAAESKVEEAVGDDGTGADVQGDLSSLSYDDVIAATGLTTDELLVKGRQVEQEEREVGRVSLRVVRKYLGSFGSWRTWATLVGVSVLLHVLGPCTDVWLALWTGDAAASPDGVSPNNVFYMVGFVAITVAYATSTFGRNFLWFQASYTASKAMHENMLWAILRAPMSFFHKTPQGRVLNRFSHDQEAADTELPDNLNDSFLAVASFIAAVAVMVVGTPPFAIVVPLVAGVMVRWCATYRASTREMSRIESISNSPVHNMFSETVDGLSTVRALSLQEGDVDEMIKRLNLNARSHFYWDMASCWFGTRLGCVGAVSVLSIGSLAVYGASIGPSSGILNSNAGLVALALVNAMGISGHMSWLVNSWIASESKMSKVERMQAYIDVEPEAPLRGGTATARVVHPATGRKVIRPPAAWPTAGCVAFNNVVMQYKAGGERVLNGVSFRTRFFERVGVVGRTGAGKSSLMQALFRMVELSEGTITIDGVDIAGMGLTDLRSKLSIIPQDPVLFSGTIRSNLAPDDGHSSGITDSEMWAALERVGMKNHVRALPLKLEGVVAEGGGNFSVGQRQLLCLARALLRKAKVMVMDEATASCDSASDALIQKTVQEAFRGCTVLTIAHRLPTIIDYDRILVMNKGKVAEFGSPWELLQKPNGMFATMVDGTGPAASAWLRQAAAASASGCAPAPPPPSLRRLRSAPSPTGTPVVAAGERLASTAADAGSLPRLLVEKLSRMQSL